MKRAGFCPAPKCLCTGARHTHTHTKHHTCLIHPAAAATAAHGQKPPHTSSQTRKTYEDGWVEEQAAAISYLYPLLTGNSTDGGKEQREAWLGTDL